MRSRRRATGLLVPSAGLIRLASESGVSDSSRARLPAAPIMDTPVGAAAAGVFAFEAEAAAAAATAAGAPPRPGPPPRVAPRVAPRRPLAPPLAPRMAADSVGVAGVAPDATAAGPAPAVGAVPAGNDGFLGKVADGLRGRDPEASGAEGVAVDVEATGADAGAFDAGVNGAVLGGNMGAFAGMIPASRQARI